MKIYTRTGDTGTTGLFGGPRVAKDDQRIEAYGTVDELNAVLGVVRTTEVSADIDTELAWIQNQLFSVGAELASPDPDKHALRIISAEHVRQVEQWIDRHEGELPSLQNFILPGGTPGAAQVHLARTLCRRAERRVVTLAGRPEAAVSSELIVFLNRLSDYLFVLSRTLNRRAGVADVPWEK
jgi:cob(I)alamin adenosyltransferase